MHWRNIVFLPYGAETWFLKRSSRHQNRQDQILEVSQVSSAPSSAESCCKKAIEQEGQAVACYDCFQSQRVSFARVSFDAKS